MRPNRVGQNIKTKMRTLDGRRFTGHLTTPVDTTVGFSNFYTPRRLLNCSINSFLVPGDAFEDPSGVKWLVTEHGTTMLRGNQLRSFQCYQITGKYKWERYGTSLDPVTNQQVQDKNPTLIDEVYAVLEPINFDDDEINIPQPRYRVLTAAEIKLHDLLDGRQVREVVDSLGVRRAEIS